MKRNGIKVFHPNSKKAEYTLLHVSDDVVAKTAGKMLGDDVGSKVADAFRSLKRLGGDSLAFHANGRKIKVELAKAA